MAGGAPVSLSSRKRRKLRRQAVAAMRALLRAEIAALPPRDIQRAHAMYSGDALRAMRYYAPGAGVVLRDQLYPMPM